MFRGGSILTERTDRHADAFRDPIRRLRGIAVRPENLRRCDENGVDLGANARDG